MPIDGKVIAAILVAGVIVLFIDWLASGDGPDPDAHA